MGTFPVTLANRASATSAHFKVRAPIEHGDHLNGLMGNKSGNDSLQDI